MSEYYGEIPTKRTPGLAWTTHLLNLTHRLVFRLSYWQVWRKVWVGSAVILAAILSVPLGSPTDRVGLTYH